MSRYLITQSLLSSWNYVFDCAEECQDEAYAEFVKTLRREAKEKTPEMQKGIEFEDEVYKVSHGVQREPHPKWESGIQAVAKEIMYAPNQVKLSKELKLGDMTFLVYGILDALKCGTIYDVKFSNTSFGSTEVYGKYLNSPQHPAYFYLLPEADKFVYLVSDGKDLYTETYKRTNTRPFNEIVQEFVESIDGMRLLGLYKEMWKAK